MTGINTDKHGNFEQNKLFNYRINYNQPLQGLSQPNYHYPNLVVKPRFNGNISEVAWKYTTPENLNTETMIYGYVYDGLNRLLAGFNQPNSDKGAGINSEIITYDANGNIQTLKRTGQKQQTSAILIDDLAYIYEGNQVKEIVDKSNNSSGFKGIKSHFGNRISYDANGNMLNLQGNYQYAPIAKPIFKFK